MKILITGGAGFIGSNLALGLVKKKHEVVVLDNLSKQIHGDSPEKTSPLYKSIAGKVEFILGDVTIKSDWEKVLPGIDVVVHLAAETGTGQSMYEIERYTKVNIQGTALLLECLTNNKSLQVNKVVVASSRSIYGEGKYLSKEKGIVYPDARQAADMDNKDFEVKFPGCTAPLELLATDEDSKIHPSSVYGITKQNQEQMIMCVCNAIGINAVAFRYQNVYGPGQSLSNPYTGILSIFSSLIINHKAINIFEDGKESRDFIYISDVVDATILGIEKDPANGQIYNVGSGVATTVVEVAETLIEKYGHPVAMAISGNYRLGYIRHNYADITKISSQLGFSPKINFEQGITLFAKWVQSQSLPQNNYEESISEMRKKVLLK